MSFELSLIVTLFLVIALNAIVDSSLCTGCCGEPGQSQKSFPSPSLLRDDQVYPESYEITYECESAVIVGPLFRRCLAGKWSDSVPKCPARFDVPGIKYTVNGVKVIISWPQAARVVSLRLGLHTSPGVVLLNYWPSAVRVKNFGLGQPKFSLVEGQDNDSMVLEVRRQRVAVQNHLITKVEIVMDSVIYDCRLGLNESVSVVPPVCLDTTESELYHLDSTIDDCDQPDAPLYTSVNSVSVIDGRLATYECDRRGYEVRQAIKNKPVKCPTNGDWSPLRLEPCELVKCDVDTALRVSIVKIFIRRLKLDISSQCFHIDWEFQFFKTTLIGK